MGEEDNEWRQRLWPGKVLADRRLRNGGGMNNAVSALRCSNQPRQLWGASGWNAEGPIDPRRPSTRHLSHAQSG